MANVTFKPNNQALREIRNSPAVMSEIDRRTQNVKARAESFGTAKYEADTQPGKTRCHGLVKTTTLHAARSNAKHNSLRRALDAARS